LGAQGVQLGLGSQGALGPQGLDGAQGQPGAPGLQGAPGFQGVQGLQGPPANNSDLPSEDTRGPQGPPGAQGVQGPQGPQSAAGTAAGPQGAIGAQGVQGAQGLQAPDGLQGPQGSQGSTNTAGLRGPQGWQGPMGVQGLQGLQGAQGLQGLQAPLVGPQSGLFTPTLLIQRGGPSLTLRDGTYSVGSVHTSAAGSILVGNDETGPFTMAFDLALPTSITPVFNRAANVFALGTASFTRVTSATGPLYSGQGVTFASLDGTRTIRFDLAVSSSAISNVSIDYEFMFPNP
jgi:hypothetical protein